MSQVSESLTLWRRGFLERTTPLSTSVRRLLKGLDRAAVARLTKQAGIETMEVVVGCYPVWPVHVIRAEADAINDLARLKLPIVIAWYAAR
jgi:hypothetical protein